MAANDTVNYIARGPAANEDDRECYERKRLQRGYGTVCHWPGVVDKDRNEVTQDYDSTSPTHMPWLGASPTIFRKAYPYLVFRELLLVLCT